jgi:hypothetical protein
MQINNKEVSMKLQKGDKLKLPPIAEVLNVSDNTATLDFGSRDSRSDFFIRVIKNWRKVLGLLGDEGLEPEVGMKVTDSTWGDGEIKYIDYHPAFPVGVEFAQAFHCYARDGKWDSDANRTLYVTERASEPLGWAVYRPGDYPSPLISMDEITEEEARSKYGDNLLHWIPDTEVV